MATPFPFELVSPEKLLISGDAISVTIPGSTGYFTMMANHAPVMSMLKIGTLDITMADGSTKTMFVKGGYADISAEGGCTILAEYAEELDKIDMAVLEQEILNAQDDLKDAKDEQKKAVAAVELAELKESELVIKQARKQG